MTRRGEFDLIAKVFAPLAGGDPAAGGLMDDAAVLEVPPDGALTVLSVDTLVAGVHFRVQDPPGRIAQKALRVNLSDLAAMGARPRGVLLSAAFSAREDDAWIDAFAAGLGADLAAYGITLLGGDTVATPGPASFSLTAIGHVPPDAVLRRSGALPGHRLWVSGCIGDAALGLDVLTGAVAAPDEAVRAALVDRYQCPDPPVALGEALRGLASAALDVSDGLVADLEHLCRTSRCGARLEAARVPLSAAARACVARDGALLERVLTGGDDYQCLFAAAPEADAAIRAAARGVGVTVTPVGHVTAGHDVCVIGADGTPMTMGSHGWRHGWSG